MSFRFLIYTIVIYTFCGGAADTVYAELSAQMYSELLQNAPESLEIEIVSVKEETAMSCHDTIVYGALVTRVHRSKSGLSVRERIYISSWKRSSEKDCTGGGPPPPQFLQIGWKGLAYLKSAGEEKRFAPAAYSKSFK